VEETKGEHMVKIYRVGQDYSIEAAGLGPVITDSIGCAGLLRSAGYDPGIMDVLDAEGEFMDERSFGAIRLGMIQNRMDVYAARQRRR